MEAFMFGATIFMAVVVFFALRSVNDTLCDINTTLEAIKEQHREALMRKRQLDEQQAQAVKDAMFWNDVHRGMR